MGRAHSDCDPETSGRGRATPWQGARAGEGSAQCGAGPRSRGPAAARCEHSGAHESKAGPCVRFHGLEQFATLRLRMDGCLTGSRLAKDRAADALTKVMIPEALDYPA